MRLGTQAILFFILSSHILSGEVHCTKHNFVLVHGFGGGAWGWYKVKSLLDIAGHNTSCPDLLSGGIDPTPVKSIKSFDQFNEPLIQLLSRIPEDQKVILVGASAGGVSLTAAINEFPEKIKVAVFLAATMLRRGFQTEDDKRIGVPPEYHHGRRELWSTVLKGDTYNKTSPEDRTLMKLLTKPDTESKEIVINAKYPERPGIDKVKRVYIKTAHDEVLLTWQQEKMIEKWPPSQVFSLESDHNAVFSAPSGVYDALIKAAEMS